MGVVQFMQFVKTNAGRLLTVAVILAIFLGAAILVLLTMHVFVRSTDPTRVPHIDKTLAFIASWLGYIGNNQVSPIPVQLVAQTLATMQSAAKQIIGGSTPIAQSVFLRRELEQHGWTGITTFTSNTTVNVSECELTFTLASGKVVRATPLSPVNASSGPAAYTMGRPCIPGVWTNVTVTTNCTLQNPSAGGIFLGVSKGSTCTYPGNATVPNLGTRIVLFPNELNTGPNVVWPSIDLLAVSLRSSYIEEWLAGPLPRVEVRLVSTTAPYFATSAVLYTAPSRSRTQTDLNRAWPKVLLVVYDIASSSTAAQLNAAGGLAHAAAAAGVFSMRYPTLAQNLNILVVRGGDFGAVVRTTALSTLVPTFDAVVEVFGTGGEDTVPVVMHPNTWTTEDVNAVNAHVTIATPAYLPSDRFPSMLSSLDIGNPKWIGVTGRLPLLGTPWPRALSNATNAQDLSLTAFIQQIDTLMAVLVSKIVGGLPLP